MVELLFFPLQQDMTLLVAIVAYLGASIESFSRFGENTKYLPLPSSLGEHLFLHMSAR